MEIAVITASNVLKKEFRIEALHSKSRFSSLLVQRTRVASLMNK